MSTIEDKKAPWETYSQSLDEKLDKKLEDEVAEYAKKRHEKTSEQNKEELARWEEENANLAQQYQFLSPAEYANEGARIGRIMHSSEFIKRLKSLKVTCWYREHPHRDKLTLLIQKGSLPPEVGCWVARGFMPEYSIVRFDKYGVPLNEKYRGWRTAVLQLILKGIISEDAAHGVFKKASGPASERYNSMLFEIRNHYAKAV